MKKILTKILFVITLCFIFICNSANALIMSESDIQMKINQIYRLENQDFSDFYNKSDLIGYRLNSFNMYVTQYKNAANYAAVRLKNVIDQINMVRNSADFSDQDKSAQISRLYQDANTILVDLNNTTINHLYSAKTVMPTLTGQKYRKKFLEFYNSLHLTDIQMI